SAAAGGRVDAFPAPLAPQQGRCRRPLPGCLYPGLRGGAEGNPPSGEAVRLRRGAEPAHQPGQARPDRLHRFHGRPRRVGHCHGRAHARPQRDGTPGTASPRSRAGTIAATLPAGGGAVAHRRPDPQRNRDPHGHRRIHRFRTSDRRHVRARRSSLRRALQAGERHMTDMSDMGETESAQKVRTEAAAWLERRQRPEWSADDQAALDAWLAAAPTNMVSYLRVEAAWTRANRLGALRQPMRDAAALPPRRNFGRFLSMAAAAVGAAAVIGGVAATYFLMPQQKSYATQVGGHEILALKDGSQIELNTSTVVRVS